MAKPAPHTRFLTLPLIREAQSEITLYLAKEIEAPELVNRLIALFDGPEQRSAQRLAADALAAAPHT